MGIGIETGSYQAVRKPGVEGSFGSTGAVRGMNGDVSVKVDPGPAAVLSLSGQVTVTTGEGPGGQTVTSFATTKPSTPLSRMIDVKA